jgi:hypothetical protein
LEAPHDPTWEERPFDRLVWRGQTSGPQWDRWSAWITSHRSRLHLLSHQEDSSREFALAIPDESHREVVKTTSAPNYRLNPSFLDTGMVGPAVQCVEETCDEMKKLYDGYDARLSFDRSNLYKCVSAELWQGSRLMTACRCVGH